MRDRYAVAANGQRLERLEEVGERLARDAEGEVDGVHPQLAEGHVVDERAEAVPDGVADDAEDFGVAVDGFVVERLAQLVHRGHPRRDVPLLVERRVGERRAELRLEDPAGEPHVRHAERDGRLRGRLHQREDAQVVARLGGADDDLDDVRVLGTHAGVDLLEIRRHLAEVVVAYDPPDGAEARDRIGDVGLEIDPVEPGDDGLADEGLALVLAPGPLAAVGRTADGGDHRARLVREEPLEVGSLLEEVEPHLDQPRALLRGLGDLVEEHAVPGAADYHTDAVHVSH